MPLSPPENDGEIAVDEAGRGCLAFEVCAAAVIFPSATAEVVDGIQRTKEETKKLLSEIKDSKKLSEKKRHELSDFVKEYALAYGVGSASPREIDSINILNATHCAMHRAIDALMHMAHERRVLMRNIVVDGSRFEAYFVSEDQKNMRDVLEDQDIVWIPHRCVPRADAEMLNVAAASILAKTYRDTLVKEYCREDPVLDAHYGLSKNKAYGSKIHLEGLRTHGPTRFHRFSFNPVKCACIPSNVA